MAAQKAAMVQLQAQTKAKLDAILSVEIELKRQEEQMDWLDLYIQRQIAVAESSTGSVASKEIEQQQASSKYHARSSLQLLIHLLSCISQ